MQTPHKRRSDDAACKPEQENPETDTAHERTKTEENIQKERQLADNSIKIERTRADTAEHLKRGHRKDVAKELLNHERLEADRHLADEREQTNFSIQETSDFLAHELLSHAKTRSDLTTRDEFLAIVSHDLRNPIGAISACAAMLLESRPEGAIDKETKTWLEFIKRNADNALRLTSDLLDIERISVGKLDLQTGPHDVAKLIKHATEQFVSLAAAKSILLSPVLADASAVITCDPDRIMQVLSNLIGNAVKFTPEHGFITLGLRSLENGGVEVSVSDTGPGIPDEKKATIFERFSQLGNKDRRGLGLGLYISKKIIEAHHGQLWVESKVGEGSKFTFTLPKETGH